MDEHDIWLIEWVKLCALEPHASREQFFITCNAPTRPLPVIVLQVVELLVILLNQPKIVGCKPSLQARQRYVLSISLPYK